MQLDTRTQRQIVNTLIQGSAAGVFNAGLRKLGKCLRNKARILLPVHDGILVEVPKRAVEACRTAVADSLEQATRLTLVVQSLKRLPGTHRVYNLTVEGGKGGKEYILLFLIK